MTENREGLSEWLGELGRFASETDMPARITDRITELQRTCAESSCRISDEMIDELLESMELRLSRDGRLVEASDTNASADKVREELRRISERYRSDNKASADRLAGSKAVISDMVNAELSDLTNTAAHIDELVSVARYTTFFNNASVKYKQSVSDMLREFTEEAHSNYLHAHRNISSALSAFAQHGSGISNGVPSGKYVSDTTGTDEKLIAEAKGSGSAANAVTELGVTTGKGVSRICRRENRKRAFLVWLPLICVIIAVAVWIIIPLFQQGQQEPAQTASVGTENSGTTLSDIADNVQKTASGLESINASLIWMYKNLWIVLIAAAAVVAAYILYVKWLRKRYIDGICLKCADYISDELRKFRDSGAVVKELDAFTDRVIEEYEKLFTENAQAYMADIKFDMGTEKPDRFGDLKQRWQAMR